MDFDQTDYLKLGTYRKNGARVDTPVWFAMDGDAFYAFSYNQAGKVKRLRNFSRVAIAPCTLTGRELGNWFETQAFLLESTTDIAAAQAALTKRYGWQYRGLSFMARLSGRYHQRSYIRILRPH